MSGCDAGWFLSKPLSVTGVQGCQFLQTDFLQERMGAVGILFFISLCQSTLSYGTMPDSSQEGILKQYKSYEDVALFHYTVPSETTRATWEFASFQVCY